MGLSCSCCPQLTHWGYEPLNGSNNTLNESISEDEDEESLEDNSLSNGLLQPDPATALTFIDGKIDLDTPLIKITDNDQAVSTEIERYHGGGLPSTQDFSKSTMVQCQGVTGESVQIEGDAIFTFVTNNDTGRRSAKESEIFNRMKRKLQLRHKHDLMPHIPWMPQYIRQLKQDRLSNLVAEPETWVPRLSTFYVTLAMCPRGKYGEELKEEAIELQNIFDEIQSPETRILVEGPPAYGKSTTALKVCQDWANGLEEYTKRFELAILILLRDFKTNTFWELLIDSTRVGTQGTSDEDIREVIEKSADKTLIILDGFDELPHGKQQFLFPLLQGDILPEATVMVTSRPSSYSSVNNSINHEGSSRPDSLLTTFEHVETCTYFYSLFQKRIIIKGIQGGQQKQFLYKHLSHAFTHTQLDKLNRVLAHNYDTKLFECPLFLLLVAILSIETNLIEAPKNRTDLYKNLFNFILKRGLSFLEDYQGTVDLFGYDKEEVPFYVLLLVSFGEFALDSVRQRQLTFTEQEILQFFNEGDNRVLKLGFMTYKDALQGFKQSTWYEPVHKTLLEFAAAYYLYYLWKCGNMDEFKLKVRSLEPFLPDSSKQVDSLVFTFLGGLMEKDPKLLFESLLPFRSKCTYWWDSYYHAILSEMEISEAFLDSLSPFITRDWFINCDRDVAFCHSSLHETIIGRALQEKRIDIIRWDICSSANFPQHLHIPNFVLHINRQSNFAYRLQCQKIECGDLYCLLLGDDFTRLKKRKWPELLVLLKTINFKRISFDFSSPCTLKFLPIVLEAAKKGYLRNKVFRRIKCELKQKKNQLLKQLLTLIEIVKVEEMHITLRGSRPTSVTSMSPTPWKLKEDELSKKLWADFIHRIAQNQYLQVFNLENFNRNSSVQIDELSLTENGRKQWKTVTVEGFVNLSILERNSQFEDITRGDAGGTAFIRAELQNKY